MAELRPETVQRLSVREVLEGSRHSFGLAEHQKDFRWGREEMERFWSELLEAHKEEMEDYPLGVLCFEIEPSGLILVADGQQKLTTTLIFLAHLRDRLEKLGESLSAKRLDSLISRRTKRGSLEPALLFRKPDREFFVKYVLLRPEEQGREPGVFPVSEQSPKSLQRIAGMYSGLSEKLDGWLKLEPDGNQAEKLLELAGTLLNVPRLVVVCRDPASRQLNTFALVDGQERDQLLADRFQCFFLPLTPSTEHKEVKRLWQEVQETVRPYELMGFLRHYWASRKELVPPTELYTVMKRHLFWEKTPIIPFLEELLGEARAYQKLIMEQFSVKNPPGKI